MGIYTEKFNEAAVKILSSYYATPDDSLPSFYVEMFKEFPHIIDIDVEGTYLNEKVEDSPSDTMIINEDGEIYEIEVEYDEDQNPNDEKEDINDNKYRFKSIDVNRTLLKIISAHPELEIIRCNEYPILLGDHLIIYYVKCRRMFAVLQNQAELHEWIAECVVEKINDEDHRFFDFVTYGQGGFDTVALEVRKQDIDLEMNYNDDLPHNEIMNFINGKQSGLIILHGNPGTGKTSYIRHLIYSSKKEFLVLDASTFNYITDSSFISLLMDYRNAVIILEDCESMLVDRIQGNGKLSALLNLSDGIIGDSFNFKFICTFNADIGKIDKALLRKGRMKKKYEFKALTPEKTAALAESIGIEIKEGESLTLADIYNYNEKNNNDKPQRVGFGVSK